MQIFVFRARRIHFFFASRKNQIYFFWIELSFFLNSNFYLFWHTNDKYHFLHCALFEGHFSLHLVTKTKFEISKKIRQNDENKASSILGSQNQEISQNYSTTLENDGQSKIMCIQNETYSYGLLFIPVIIQSNPCLSSSFYPNFFIFYT